MSGWLCYTRKMLASAIASIAEDLEQTALDLNEVVHTVGLPREAALEQRLYSGYGSAPQSQYTKSRATTQQPLTSSVLPVHVVPGDLILENHFSTPDPPKKKDLGGDALNMDQSLYEEVFAQELDAQMVGSGGCGRKFIDASPKPEVIERNGGGCVDPGDAPIYTGTPTCRSLQFSQDNSSPSFQQTVKLGDKRPGKVIRTSSGEPCDADSPVIECEDQDETNARLSSECNNRVGDIEERLGDQGDNPESPKSRWMGQFSRAMNFAYAQVSNAVLTMMEDMAEMSESVVQEEQNRHRLTVRVTPPGRAHDYRDIERPLTHLTVDVSNSPATCQDRPETATCHLSPISNHSAYSTDSFEVIDAPAFLERKGGVGGESSGTHSPVIFIIGEDEEDDESDCASNENSAGVKIAPIMTSSSAEYVNFNFSNLISGRYFGIASPSPSGQPGSAVADTAQADDDDASFDVLSEPSEEDFVVYH